MQLREYIQTELAGAVFKSQDGFLQQMFPIDEAIVDRIYSRMIDNGYYEEGIVPTTDRGNRIRDTAGGSWKDIPLRVRYEVELYPGFVKVGNAIAECCTSPQLSVRWIDSHSNAPASSLSSTNQLMPDIAALALPDNPKTNLTLEDEKGRPTRLWWRRVLVPMEVKQISGNPAIIQLMSYIRLVLREQADRRFTFGFVLSLQTFTVYIADRSGSLQSIPINIHQEPKTFIRVMAGLSLLSPSRLGWDTTMKILKNPEAPVDRLEYEYSWRTGEIESPGIGLAYDEAWVVEMTTKGDDGVERRVQFVLFEALSLLRAGVIRGRGTRIWKAWKMDDMHLAKDRRHVSHRRNTVVWIY
jgi:hypothetical protein